MAAIAIKRRGYGPRLIRRVLVAEAQTAAMDNAGRAWRVAPVSRLHLVQYILENSMKVSVLGTKYTIREVPRGKDRILETCDGYCDKTSKKIVIVCDVDSDFENPEVYRKKIMRHEIIHAFLFESGLHENFEHNQFGHDETFLDWVAVQYPKLKRAFAEAGCDE